ncbi:hypothetical protein NDU88_007691 [Pleurodeles waltl]|uniref:Uncharacterized protein n=1 Tax=Pleurodeles waltl TaxID=8319 RepID=A0AAV7PUN5_PLEWA|nr:hypothetical protein NDU88_007691 [Pleurodeles waltl]
MIYGCLWPNKELPDSRLLTCFPPVRSSTLVLQFYGGAYWAPAPIRALHGHRPRIAAHLHARRRTRRSGAWPPVASILRGRCWAPAPIRVLPDRGPRPTPAPVVVCLGVEPGALVFQIVWMGGVGPKPRSAPTSVSGRESRHIHSPVVICIGVKPGSLVLRFFWGGDVRPRPRTASTTVAGCETWPASSPVVSRHGEQQLRRD